MTDSKLIEKMTDTLIWCSGSSDFAPGGQGHEAWKRTVRPLIDEGLRRQVPWPTWLKWLRKRNSTVLDR